MKTKTLDRYLRPWGADKRYQCFLGSFSLHPSGLWFFVDTNKAKVARAVQVFGAITEQLRLLAAEYETTISFSPYPWTTSENGSAIYAQWDNRDKLRWSPHIEFGTTSFQKFLLPHFAHELSHLWWRTRTEDEREKFRRYLEKTTSREAKEVTAYCHSMFTEYVQYTSTVDTTRPPDCRKKVTASYRESWAEEAFCETVARLTDSSYHQNDWQTTVDVEARRKGILECTGLTIE
ncbi:MAG: hypothetical protein K2Z81_25530 [Cyanobacteria bacterium]|nr:hypothetical protein [Cyanobacteriota bacterium]